MKKLLLLAVAMPLICMMAEAQVNVGGLKTENLLNPVGIDALKPRFSWVITADHRNILQSAYEIKVTQGKQIAWNSGKKQSEQSVHVEYSGTPLESGKKYIWQVRVWDNNGKASKWSQPAFFQTGFLKQGDWKAKWIEPASVEDPTRPVPLLRRQFTVSKKIVSATAYITSHGLYEAFINGKRVGDDWLTPGWTSYKKRLQYQVYDVTDLVARGSNAIGVMLGNGWYRGIIGYANNINVYGKDVALLLQIDILYSDGTSEQIISDGSWKSSTGEIKYSEIYNGEIADARLVKDGWKNAGYNDAEWQPVKESEFDNGILLATWNEPVKLHETFNPAKILKTPSGDQVIDFGQNLVGWVAMKVTGPAGTKITLSHAEVLDKEGNFYTENLRQAKAQDEYTLKGEGQEIFHPHFTWHGFRYVKVEGYPGDLKPENFKAMVLYSAMSQTGTFSTSDPMINQLQHNIEWGQKGNFIDVPTDCPQRDERLGWTGDAQVFSRTAAFNMNVNSFFAKWLKDLEADQIEGKVPFVVPNVLGTGSVNSAGWADAATIIPWNMYLVYGDKRILQQQYASMKAYVESIRKIAKDNLWNTGFHFGDWLFYRPDDDNDGRAAVTDKYLIAQCFYAHSTQLLINTARILGKTEDESFYSLLLNEIKKAFVREYMTPNGRLVSGTQTAYVLALNFDMLPEELRKQAADRLAENVKAYNVHLTTGFLGTPYLCDVLTRFGYTDLAYQLLLTRSYPSWLYPVTMGATTIWERWDGQKPDSTFQTPDMNSFNHYAYGAIGDWMYRVMAGLDTYEDGVGYKHSRIMPHTGRGFKNVSAALDTYYGKLSSSWKLDSQKLSLTVEIPANTKCTVYIPGTDVAKITEGGKPISQISEIRVAGTENGYVMVQLGSGKYQFVRE
jgi:alpha-L-rhamnosidase